MNTSHAQPIQRRGLLLSLALAAIIGLSMLLVRASQAKPRPLYYQPPQGEKMLYLAPPSGGANDLLASTDLAANGITIVYTGDELQQQFAVADYDAIILHKNHLQEVDTAWLQKLYGQHGVVIAGINLTVLELGQLLSDGEITGTADWTDGWQREPFFSIVAMRAATETEPYSGNPVRQMGMATTDNIRAPSDVEVFLSLIRRDIQDIRAYEVNELGLTPETK